MENLDPGVQLLKYKQKCGVILGILNDRAQKEDVEDFVSTIETVQRIIDRIVSHITNADRKEVAVMLSKLQNSLEEYEAVVVKVEKTGKLKRFLTNNRLRKKLETINSVLHKDCEFFIELAIQVEVMAKEREQESTESVRVARALSTPNLPGYIHSPLDGHLSLSTSSMPTARTSGTLRGQPAIDDGSQYGSVNPVVRPATSESDDIGGLTLTELLKEPASHKDFDDPNGRYASFTGLLQNEELFRDDWDAFFGQERAEWTKFIEFLNVKVAVNENDEKILRYVIDNSCTGLISKHKYKEFLKGFGPLERCLENVKKTFKEEWFYGYLSSRESELLLYAEAPGTFLMRLSKSAPGAFALAFVFEPTRIIHILITSNQPYGFSIQDQESGEESRFKDFPAILAFYKNVLVNPFRTSLPRQPWFQGDLTGDESVELLTNQNPGNFVVRFSAQQPGFYAASYVDNQGKIRHSLIEPILPEEGFGIIGFKLAGDAMQFASLEVLIENYSNVLTTPLRLGNDIDFGTVKEIVATETNQVHPPEENEAFYANEINVDEMLGDLINDMDTQNPPVQPPAVNPEAPPPQPVVTAPPPEVEYLDCVAKLALEDAKYPGCTVYLLSDSLVLSSNKFWLAMTWIEELSDEFKNGTAFRIISPEKRIVVCARDKAEKKLFLECAKKQILGVLRKEGTEVFKETTPENYDGKIRVGKYTFTNGAYFEGCWNAAVFDGYGTYLLPSGSKYQGDWVKSLREGRGTQLEANGEKYEGSWKDNLKDGSGTFYYSSNVNLLRFEGNWRQDKRHGVGTIFYIDGSIIRCEWDNDLQLESKYFTLVYSNGDCYAGECTVAGPTPDQLSSTTFTAVRSGFGIMRYHQSGDRYFGSWYQDKPSGVGYFSGSDYEFLGEWQDGKILGPGDLVLTSKKHRISGTFHAPDPYPVNLEIKQGTFTHGNGSVHVGPDIRWRPFLKLPRFVNFRLSELGRALNETLSPNIAQLGDGAAVDYPMILPKIMTNDIHPLGAITSSFCSLFKSIFGKLSGADLYDSKTITSDVKAFVACLTNHVVSTYQVFQSNSGQDLVLRSAQEAIFPRIYNTLMDVLIENHKHHNKEIAFLTEDFRTLSLHDQMLVCGVDSALAATLESRPESPFIKSIELLTLLPSLQLPYQKVDCTMKSIRELETSLKASFEGVIGADNLLPCICFVVTQLKFNNVYTELTFMEEFTEEAEKNGVEGYLITQFQVALNYLQSSDFTKEMQKVRANKQASPAQQVGTFEGLPRVDAVSPQTGKEELSTLPASPPEHEVPSTNRTKSPPDATTSNQPTSPQKESAVPRRLINKPLSPRESQASLRRSEISVKELRARFE
eukprot:TRINITY_DN5537_c0_g1_i2.p1 TRINITY_DN5537_c0_g1~~TRINITY_DN5537_c0_g1_i2.p1  ORF type:complete len:1350 (-),score=354.65 TRINITY_DN5537_c0_g1_i2:24-4073(-)